MEERWWARDSQSGSLLYLWHRRTPGLPGPVLHVDKEVNGCSLSQSTQMYSFHLQCKMSYCAVSVFQMWGTKITTLSSCSFTLSLFWMWYSWGQALMCGCACALSLSGNKMFSSLKKSWQVLFVSYSIFAFLLSERLSIRSWKIDRIQPDTESH